MAAKAVFLFLEPRNCGAFLCPGIVMKQNTKNYKVLASFKWRGRWADVGEVLSLLPTESQQLLRMKKIELVKDAAPAVTKADSTAKGS